MQKLSDNKVSHLKSQTALGWTQLQLSLSRENDSLYYQYCDTWGQKQYYVSKSHISQIC